MPMLVLAQERIGQSLLFWQRIEMRLIPLLTQMRTAMILLSMLPGRIDYAHLSISVDRSANILLYGSPPTVTRLTVYRRLQVLLWLLGS